MIDLTKLLTYGLEYFGLYYGTYKGYVVSNQDPQNQGRVQVHLPTVHGAQYPSVWAYPISPYAGKQFGFYAIPDIGEMVYVRFDHGRVEYPMWEGGWWGKGDPTSDMIPSKVVLATREGLKIVIDRSARTLLIQQSGEADDFMAISNPKGLVEPGNLTIWNRPVVQNSDGTHSSEYSVSFEDDQGREVLVPTVVDGKFLTPDGTKPPEGSDAEKTMFQAAWDYYLQTGENLGKFDNADDADAYSQILHNRGPRPGPCSITLDGNQVSIDTTGTVLATTPVFKVSQALVVGDGATGSFTTNTGQVVTVQDGIVTSIE